MLKSTQKKWPFIYIEGKTVRMTDFSSETMEARRKWLVFQVLKDKYCQPQSLHPEKITFGMKGKSIFTDERKLGDYVASKFALKE